MNKRQSQTLHQAVSTLEQLGYTRESKAIKRVIDTEIRNSPEYEAAWNHHFEMTGINGRVDMQQAFAYWYAMSGRSDLEQAYREYLERTCV
jgi:hypothetical protein